MVGSRATEGGGNDVVYFSRIYSIDSKIFCLVVYQVVSCAEAVRTPLAGPPDF